VREDIFANERIIWGTSDEGASALFVRILKRTVCLICRVAFVNRCSLSIELIAIYFHPFNFHHPNLDFIIKSNYFQNAQKSECFFDDFEALVRECRFPALVLQNRPRSHSSARTSISRTAMRSGNVILKVVSSKIRCHTCPIS
jgi:hypothetical protein